MRFRSGFSKFELIALTTIVGVAAAVAVPEVMASRARDAQQACATKLGQVEFAKEQWALEHRKSSGTKVSEAELVPSYISAQNFDDAKQMAKFSINPIGTKSTCDCGK